MDSYLTTALIIIVILIAGAGVGLYFLYKSDKSEGTGGDKIKKKADPSKVADILKKSTSSISSTMPKTLKSAKSGKIYNVVDGNYLNEPTKKQKEQSSVSIEAVGDFAKACKGNLIIMSGGDSEGIGYVPVCYNNKNDSYNMLMAANLDDAKKKKYGFTKEYLENNLP